MQEIKVLIVEDDPELRRALVSTVELAGYKALQASDGLEALNILQKESVHITITDKQMPNMNGQDFSRIAIKKWPNIPVVLITAYGEVQNAVQCIKEGVADYLLKPFEAEVLVSTIERYVAPIREDVDSEFIRADIKSEELAKLGSRVARTDATVLISGESGCGKEVIARYIHNTSRRSEGPFIAINCAAIPDNMLEATLFGYDKGAFTGAYKASPGKFELADGGTLLLDEISEMDLALQAKLLRAIQEKEIERLGGNKIIRPDIRIIATTNRDLKACVESGSFREDLFYRLSVFPISIAPLRDRPKDIQPLAESFIEKHFDKYCNSVTGDNRMSLEKPNLSDKAVGKLMSYYWPGNVRELENVVQRALIYCQCNRIEEEDVHFEMQSAGKSKGLDLSQDHSLGQEVQSHEHKKILQVMFEERGNRKTVADRLGISQRTLRYKLARMREKGVEIPDNYSATNQGL